MATYRDMARSYLQQLRNSALTEGLYLSGTYTRHPAPVYNPATGDVTPGVPTTVTVRVRKESFDLAEVDNDRVLHTDCKFSLQQVELPDEPEADEELTVGGDSYKVVRALESAPGVTWLVQARAAT